MWIRSQNQENYLDASGKTFSIYNGNQIHLKYANSSIFLGKYSFIRKHLKCWICYENKMINGIL